MTKLIKSFSVSMGISLIFCGILYIKSTHHNPIILFNCTMFLTVCLWVFCYMIMFPEKYSPIPKTISQLEAERLAWSFETFTEATPISSLRKLEAEIKEIESDINAGIREPMEYADALMCLFDSAGRQGIYPAEIFDCFEKKLAINKARTWNKNSDNSYSPIKPQQ
jgi:hypothetical protein